MAKSKLIQCKHCGREIAASAKVCPYCGGKNKKPIYKRWWFWVIIVILLISVFGGSGGSKSTNNTSTETVATSLQSSDNASGEGTTAVAQESQTETAQVEETTEVAESSKAEDNVPTEYKNALAKAEMYSSMMYMSKKGIYDQLTSEYGEKFPADAAQYAVDHVQVDWNANALEKAKTYQSSMNMSKAAIYDQLTSEYGEQFTADEAQYAVDHLN